LTTIATVEALRDDALQAHPAGRQEGRWPVLAVEVLERRKAILAGAERQGAKVVTVEQQEVEGE
jgi:hypothetical protein